MAMTSSLKDELAHLTITKPCCRKAEVSALLRFGGSIHIVAGALVIEAELDTAFVARRLRQTLAEIFGHDSEMVV
ncbi:MAG: DNA-binding protein WhiA, partial [Actinomycetota bacterium]